MPDQSSFAGRHITANKPQKVEFYFGDSNLPTDNFLWGATDGTTNLPVKVATICTFGRMKRFKSIAAVVAALRDSDFLEVTGPEGLEEVKRKYPYDPTIKSKSLPRSIYAKGFGDEEPSSQFDIEAFFTPYGPIKQVRLRRTDDKLFKGSVFVEFQDEELAEAFLKLDPKPLWKGEHVLKIKSKKEYNQEKAEEIKDGKVQPGPTHTARGGYRGRGDRGGRAGHRGHRNDRDGRDRGRHDRGDRDPDDWKKRREDDRANGFRGDRDRRQNTRGRGRGRHDRGRRDSDRNHEHEDNDAKNGYDESILRLNIVSNNKPVSSRTKSWRLSLKPTLKNPKLRARSVHERIMKTKKSPQRRSIRSPMSLPSLHNIRFRSRV